MVGFINVDIFDILPAARPEHYIIAPLCWCTCEGHHLLFVSTPPLLLYYSNYICTGHARAQRLWRAVMLEFSVCAFPDFLGIAHDRSLFAEGSSGLPPI